MFYPVLFLLLLSVVGFYLNKNKSVYLSKNQKLASLPAYYGYLAFLYIFVPAIIIWVPTQRATIANIKYCWVDTFGAIFTFWHTKASKSNNFPL